MGADGPLNSISDANNRRSQAWRVFFEATTRMQGVLETRLKKTTGVTLADYNILLTLYEAEGGQLRMGELADRVVFSPSRLTYLTSRLEKIGAIEKLPADTDGRGFIARLTESGKALTIEVTAIHQGAVRELLLDDMTDADIDSIVEAFERAEDSNRSA